MKKAKNAKKKVKVKVKVCLNPPGSSLLTAKSLQRLRRRCGISEEIVLVTPSPADRANAPPPGYMTLECGVVISTEHLSYLTDFRVRGRSEELKNTITNSSWMALIAGFPSKDDHFEDRFFFVEISERTASTLSRRDGKEEPSLPEVSKEFVTAMHTELSSGNGNWRKSFSRRRIERALSAEIFPGKILGRGQARVSFNEQAALEAAAKSKGSAGTSTPRVVAPTSLTLTVPSARARSSRPLASKTLLPPPSSGELAEFRRLSAERARISSVIGRETSASRVGGLVRDEAYSAVKSKASELSLFFDRLKVDELSERNEILEHDALSVQKVKKGYEDKLTELKSRCTKAEGEVVHLRGELSSASDLQRSRIDNAVARPEMRWLAVFRGELVRLPGYLQRSARRPRTTC
ncbi:hypothetical protein AALP_AA7G137700 [Arabis alpina]|uniref:Uncharacterized protein n=1 Tax=Arabis alpina TaxID=50452 RepID=A0A087GHW6_ARAAL|nr:hypothetical protein AALP_AA7G137700 [Arabis alpina]